MVWGDAPLPPGVAGGGEREGEQRERGPPRGGPEGPGLPLAFLYATPRGSGGQLRVLLWSPSRVEGRGFQHLVALAGAAVTALPPPRGPSPFLRTDKRAFFIICTSELGPPQIYELVALTSSDKNT